MTETFPSNLHVGTSSWSTTDWYGVFYPPDIQPGDFITHYAKQFDTVEIDATFYRQPGKEMVDGWNKRTPDDFIFAAKVPQLITHEKYLEDCQQEMTNFVKTMARLGDKLGPLVFQFSYFPKKKDEHEYKTGDDFRQRLKKFLPTLPKEFRFTVEIRNSNWLGEELLGLLRKHNVALTVACYYTMPALDQLMKQFDLVTSDFSYIRFLGNHKHMDSLIDRLMQESNKEKHWNELIVDRTAEMERWITAIRELVDRKIDVFAYFNNHYAGFAPGSIKLFRELWQKSREGQSKTPKSEPKRRKP